MEESVQQEFPLSQDPAEVLPRLNPTGRLKLITFLRKGAEILVKLPYSEMVVPFLRLAASEALCFSQYGRGDMPLVIGIETTATCNRACKYCTVPKPEFRVAHPARYMESDQYGKILKQLSEIPRTRGRRGFCGTVHLNGYGEPLMDRGISKKVAEARAHLPEARIGFYSNGDLLTEEKYLELRAAGVDEILITPHDGAHKPALVELAKKYAADRIISLRPPLAAYANRGGEITLDESATQQAPPRVCIHPTYAMELFADGQVAYCANDSLLKRPVGNVSTSSVLEVWDDPSYKQLRSDLRHARVDRLPEVCLACRTQQK